MSMLKSLLGMIPAVLVALSFANLPLAEAGTKKVVFVAGHPSHGYGAHEHYAGSRLLSDWLTENHQAIRAKVYRNGWPEDPEAFEGVDAIVIFADGGGGHPAYQNREQFETLVQAGVGVVLLHWGTGVPMNDFDRQWIEWVGANKEPHWSVNPHWIIEDQKLADHPVNQGVTPYTLNDEWYFHLRFREEMKGVTPIMSAHPPKETVQRADGPFRSNPHVREAVLERGEIQHVAWAAEREGGGRSFGLTGAHWHWNWGHPMLRRQVLNAIVWTAGAEVPAGGMPVGTVTIEDLKANQDFDMPENFDLDHWARLVKQWQEVFAE